MAWPSVDLKFTNTTPYGVLVTAKVVKSTPSTEGSATVSMYSTRRWKITSKNGRRTDTRQPGVRYQQGATCEEFTGVPGFSVDVFRFFRAPHSGKVLRKEKFHTDYIAGDDVRCGAPPKPVPRRKQRPRDN